MACGRLVCSRSGSVTPLTEGDPTLVPRRQPLRVAVDLPRDSLAITRDHVRRAVGRRAIRTADADLLERPSPEGGATAVEGGDELQRNAYRPSPQVEGCSRVTPHTPCSESVSSRRGSRTNLVDTKGVTCGNSAAKGRRQMATEVGPVARRTSACYGIDVPGAGESGLLPLRTGSTPMRFWILEGAEASPLPLFPKEQEAAARLLAKTLNPDEVDKVCSLPAGRSRKLLHEDDRFRAKVIRFRRELDMFRVRSAIFAAGLGERQRRCAELIGSGHTRTGDRWPIGHHRSDDPELEAPAAVQPPTSRTCRSPSGGSRRGCARKARHCWSTGSAGWLIRR